MPTCGTWKPSCWQGSSHPFSDLKSILGSGFVQLLGCFRNSSAHKKSETHTTFCNRFTMCLVLWRIINININRYPASDLRGLQTDATNMGNTISETAWSLPASSAQLVCECLDNTLIAGTNRVYFKLWNPRAWADVMLFLSWSSLQECKPIKLVGWAAILWLFPHGFSCLYL